MKYNEIQSIYPALNQLGTQKIDPSSRYPANGHKRLTNG